MSSAKCGILFVLSEFLGLGPIFISIDITTIDAEVLTGDYNHPPAC